MNTLEGNKKPKYWYSKEIHVCVLCGREKIYKERVYAKKDKNIKTIEYACPEHFI